MLFFLDNSKNLLFARSHGTSAVLVEPQTPDFQTRKSHVKKFNSILHFCNISTDSKHPAIRFFRTGLIYAYILT